jgi:hypothetical protein
LQALKGDADQSTPDLILKIRHLASKKATLEMESGYVRIKICPQKPETPIFAHTQEAHYPILAMEVNSKKPRQKGRRSLLFTNTPLFLS